MKQLFTTILIVIAFILPAQAEESIPFHKLRVDYVRLPGKVSSKDFYRAIACGAKPGEKCQHSIRKWPADKARNLRVSMPTFENQYSSSRMNRASRALDRALAQLNGLGANLKLTRVAPDAPADIRVYMLDTKGNTVIKGTGVKGLDGVTLQGGLFRVWSDRKGNITKAVIAVSSTLPPDIYRRVMQEEVTQSLGLFHDIRSNYYDTRSMFSQDSPTRQRLTAIDQAVVRMHYPKP